MSNRICKTCKTERGGEMKRIVRLIFSGCRLPKRHKVVIHFDDGDWETTMVNRMIYVPWLLNAKVPMFCENDGTVTLRLMYGSVPCKGWGKQYGNTTWEYAK